MTCNLTGNTIIPFMSFGKMPIANWFLKKKDFSKGFFYNLKVGFSEKFSLFQLDEYPSVKRMFHKNYPFYTSSSKFMIRHFKEYAKWSKKFLSSNSKIWVRLTFLMFNVKTELSPIDTFPIAELKSN